MFLVIYQNYTKHYIHQNINRTLFYDALLPMLGKDKLFDELDNELELVRDGQKSWEAFCDYANVILKEIEEKFKDS